jgi:hypothetical protein
VFSELSVVVSGVCCVDKCWVWFGWVFCFLYTLNVILLYSNITLLL